MFIHSRQELKQFFLEFVINDSPKKFYTGKFSEYLKNKLNLFVYKKDGIFKNTSEQIYWLMNDITTHPLCPTCNKNELVFLNGNVGYRKHCSTSCSTKNVNVRKKLLTTCREKYGEDFEKIIKEKSSIKRKETMVDKYGVDHNFKLDNFIEKRNATQRVKYNGLLANQSKIITKKKNDTLMKNHGCSNLFEMNKKRTIEKYGVEYLLQDPTFYDKWSKMAYKWKTYILPSGKEIQIQGYEGFALNLLLSKYNEDDIVFHKKEIPKIWYKNKNETKHLYYPDFYIPKENLIIEVKSKYILEKHLESNIKKFEAVIENGFKFELMCFSREGNVVSLDIPKAY